MRLLSSALALTIALIASAFIISKPWITVRQTKPITVKGYAEANIQANSGSLTAEVFETGQNNAEAYQKAGTSLDAVNELTSHILQSGYESVELSTSINETVKLNEKGQRTNFVDFYTARRSIRITTSDVHGLKKLERALYDLNTSGLHINLNGPAFFTSGLDLIKNELLEAATSNGKERAQILAQSSGENLGPLVSAKQGVIQITKPNSSETSSWGIYDTETIHKVIKLVVTLEFEVDS